MKLKQYITRRYAIHCLDCGHELSIYSTFTRNKFAVKCNACKRGYIYERQENCLTPSSITDEIEEFFKHDKYHKYYVGVPTSQAFMPKWLKKFF